jgi:hypothetical protein
VTVYAVTNSRPPQACTGVLDDWIRGHWAIERWHHIGDTTFAEDPCQVRTGTGPRPHSRLRYLPVGILRARGHRNITAALRRNARNARDASGPLTLFGSTSP